MLITEQDRLRLEQDILGIIISRNCYQQIAHILNEKNFYDWPDHPHRLIFKTIAECGPAVCIDLVIVSQLLRMKHPSPNLKFEYLGIENYINLLASNVVSSANLTYQSFLLLEHDLTRKLMHILLKQCQRLTEPSDRVHANEAYEMLRDGEDVFKMMEKLPKYLENVCYPHAMVDNIREFTAGVDRRIFDLKKLEQIDNIVSCLISFCDVTNFARPQAAIKVLTSTIKHIAFEDEVSEYLYEKIDELKQSLG